MEPFTLGYCIGTSFLLGGTGTVFVMGAIQRKLFKDKPSSLDFFLADGFFGPILIVLMGAAGFWIPSKLLPPVLEIIQNGKIETVKTNPTEVEVLDDSTSDQK